MSKLVIVQCGGSKIWKKNPNRGRVPAKEAYASPYFKKNRAYAERFGDHWMILSAKYGFLEPEELIEDYNVTFKTKKTKPITVQELREQVKEKDLLRFDEIVVLGGAEYLEATREAFQRQKSKVTSPFEGLSIGYRMAALDKTLAEDEKKR